MKLIFACGGTGGHINPALSMANLIRQRHPEAKILFVGAAGGMEEKLVPREGFDIETVDIRGVRHSFTPKALKHNVKVLAGIGGSLRQAGRILKRFEPDVVVGTGGYACFPVVYKAASMHIPTAIHESNASPGLTTKLLSKRVDKVMVNMPDTHKQYSVPVEVTGMPIREEFLDWDKKSARTELGIDDRAFVAVTFGSLGARDMNKTMADFIKLAVKDGDIQLCYGVGKLGKEIMPKLMEEAGIDLKACPQINVSEYIYNMPQVMQAADIVIGRAGASTINEIMLTGTPAILFPSPNVTNNHQAQNARVLSDAGASVLRHESDTDGKQLYALVREMLSDKAKLAKMSAKLMEMAIPDASERIYQILMKMVVT